MVAARKRGLSINKDGDEWVGPEEQVTLLFIEFTQREEESRAPNQTLKPSSPFKSLSCSEKPVEILTKSFLTCS